MKLKKSALCELPIGKKAVICSLPENDELRLALMRLGLCKQTEIQRVLSSPFGDPCAYLCRGTIISIRNSDSRNITVISEEDNDH